MAGTWFTSPTVLSDTHPRLLLASCLVSHPPNNPAAFANSKRILKEHDIGLIINTATDVHYVAHLCEFYTDLRIRVVNHRIDDSLVNEPPVDFLDNIVESLSGEQRGVLVNCHMGVNRSAFAAGALLWSVFGCYASGADMIKDMRRRQAEQRDGLDLLVNPLFESRLLEYCLRPT